MDMTKNVQTRMGVKVVTLDMTEKQQKKKFAYLMRKQKAEYYEKCCKEYRLLKLMVEQRQREYLLVDSDREAARILEHLNGYLLPHLHEIEREIENIEKYGM